LDFGLNFEKSVVFKELNFILWYTTVGGALVLFVNGERISGLT